MKIALLAPPDDTFMVPSLTPTLLFQGPLDHGKYQRLKMNDAFSLELPSDLLYRSQVSSFGIVDLTEEPSELPDSLLGEVARRETSTTVEMDRVPCCPSALAYRARL